MTYNEEYFTTINYTDYLQRASRYHRLAKEITNLLEKLCLINKNSRILDYGCAVGFLMKGLELVGYQNVWGYDISTWAIQKAQQELLNIIYNIKDTDPHWELVFALDVLEHMTDNQINDLFQTQITSSLIVRIPCSVDDGKTFHLEVSKRDPTHINCKTKENWTDFLLTQGNFKTYLNLNLYTIYDSPGVMCGIFLK